jgi:hypothetical protein
MKRTIVRLLGAAPIVVMVATAATDASAWWQRGWGPGIAAGVVGGAVIAGAIIAARPPGYVVYEGYAASVYAPGCYWASRPVYDGAGRVVGYTGRPVQVCPGYSGPLAGNTGAPPPGSAGGLPGGGPPGYAGGPPAGDPVAFLHAAFPVIRSENRNLSRQGWPAPFLSVIQITERMLIWETD